MGRHPDVCIKALRQEKLNQTLPPGAGDPCHCRKSAHHLARTCKKRICGALSVTQSLRAYHGESMGTLLLSEVQSHVHLSVGGSYQDSTSKGNALGQAVVGPDRKESESLSKLWQALAALPTLIDSRTKQKADAVPCVLQQNKSCGESWGGALTSQKLPTCWMSMGLIRCSKMRVPHGNWPSGERSRTSSV